MEGILAGREFLRALGSSIRSFALYPSGHPLREQKLEELLSWAREVFRRQGSFDIFVHEESFFFGERLLPKESITLQWMLKRWQELQVHALTVNPQVRHESLSDLIVFLSGQGPPPTESVQINAAALMRPGEHAPPVSTSRLRSAYSNALEVMREFGERVGRGARPSAGVARETVEGLVDAILADRESALLLATMHSYDEQTFFHMVNVCILSVATGAAVGLERDHLSVLGLGGLLHDIGKLSVPIEVLNRSGPLTEEDWAQIRRHPVSGGTLILRSADKISPIAASIAVEHHVHLAGGGYPSRAVHDIPDLFSRIVAIADTFDALTSRRPYRRAEQRQRALDVLLSGAGPHYDARIVKVFVRMLGFFPPGSVVQLNDGTAAVVVRNNHDALAKPQVKIVRGPAGEALDIDVDLALDPDGRAIVKGLDQSEGGMDPSELVP